MIVDQVDEALSGHVSRLNSPTIIHEKPVGLTVVYTRYGAYHSSILDPRTGHYVNDPIGVVHPAWIQDLWVHYPNLLAVKNFAEWPKHTKAGYRKVGR